MKEVEVGQRNEPFEMLEGWAKFERILCEGIADAGTVEAFARAIKASPNSVHRWLSRLSQPRRSSVCRIIAFVASKSKSDEGGSR
jgi:hypothetical protein